MLPGVDCLPSSIPDDTYLEVTKIQGKPDKQRKTYVLCGLSHNHNYAVYNNNLQAIIRAINERVFCVDYGDGFVRPYQPHQDFYNTALREVSEFFDDVPYVTPMTAMQFAGSYVGRRRTIYEQAAASLVQTPLSPKDAYIKAFVKAEKYNFTKKPNPAPRIIQPRDPRFIVESGRHIKVIEKKIYERLNNLFGHTTIFKGLNAEDRGRILHEKWSDFVDPVAVGLDAKRFDQHVSRTALEWEHSIYRKFFPHNRFFAWLLRLQLRNVGFARCNSGTVKYTVDGCRMSGDSNTALGNCLIMSSLVYAYAKQLGIRIRLANDGDDCVVIMERRHLELFSLDLEEFFIEAGFSLTVETPVYVFEEIEFCQCHPVFDGEKYIMVRDLRVAISKDCVAMKPLDNDRVFKMWMAAVGQGGISLTGGIPVWQNFYNTLNNLSEGASPLSDMTMNTGMKLMGKGMFRKYAEPTPASRLSFFLAFGISPYEQEVLEQFYDHYQLGPSGSASRFVPLPLENTQH